MFFFIRIFCISSKHSYVDIKLALILPFDVEKDPSPSNNPDIKYGYKYFLIFGNENELLLSIFIYFSSFFVNV